MILQNAQSKRACRGQCTIRLRKKRSLLAGYGAISWADLEVLSAKVANEAVWRDVKKLRGVPSSGDVISSAFGAAWPVKLGRQDADQPDPEGRLPKPDATVAEITVRPLLPSRMNQQD